MPRNKLSLLHDDERFLRFLGGLDPIATMVAWNHIGKDTPCWRMVAIARRLRAQGQPILLAPWLVRMLEQRRRHREPAHTWAALPNLQRMAAEAYPPTTTHRIP